MTRIKGKVTVVDDYQTKILEYVLASNIMILANQIKSLDTVQGRAARQDYVAEAIKQLQDQSDRVFEGLSELV
jgi:hypothetical protein